MTCMLAWPLLSFLFCFFHPNSGVCQRTPVHTRLQVCPPVPRHALYSCSMSGLMWQPTGQWNWGKQCLPLPAWPGTHPGSAHVTSAHGQSTALKSLEWACSHREPGPQNDQEQLAPSVFNSKEKEVCLWNLGWLQRSSGGNKTMVNWTWPLSKGMWQVTQDSGQLWPCGTGFHEVQQMLVEELSGPWWFNCGDMSTYRKVIRTKFQYVLSAKQGGRECCRLWLSKKANCKVLPQSGWEGRWHTRQRDGRDQRRVDSLETGMPLIAWRAVWQLLESWLGEESPAEEGLHSYKGKEYRFDPLCNTGNTC